PVTGRPERPIHAPLLPHQHPTRCAHAAGNDDRLPYARVNGRDFGMTRRECTRRPLAMNTDLFDSTIVALVILKLRDVVGDVVNELHPECFPRLTEDSREDLARLVRQELTIAPGEVGGSAHRPQIRLALWAPHGGARKLPVGKLKAV